MYVCKMMDQLCEHMQVHDSVHIPRCHCSSYVEGAACMHDVRVCIAHGSPTGDIYFPVVCAVANWIFYKICCAID